MKNTKEILKRTVQSALKSEFGFSPSLQDITLLENTNRTYIMFQVRDKFYQFNSYEMNGGVWVGEGTIKRVDEKGFTIV